MGLLGDLWDKAFGNSGSSGSGGGKKPLSVPEAERQLEWAKNQGWRDKNGQWQPDTGAVERAEKALEEAKNATKTPFSIPTSWLYTAAAGFATAAVILGIIAFAPEAAPVVATGGVLLGVSPTASHAGTTSEPGPLGQPTGPTGSGGPTNRPLTGNVVTRLEPGARKVQYMAWSNDVGWIHVGTVDEFKAPQQRGSEIWGGRSTDLLTKIPQLGGKQFDNLDDAMQALAAEIGSKLVLRRAPLAFPKVFYMAGDLKVGFEIVEHPAFKSFRAKADSAK